MQSDGFCAVLLPRGQATSVSDYDRRYTRGSVLQSDPQAGAGSSEAPALPLLSLATEAPLRASVSSELLFLMIIILRLVGVAFPLCAAVLVLFLLAQKEASGGSVPVLPPGSHLLSLPEQTGRFRCLLPP